MAYWHQLLIIAAVHFVALVIPEPDFALITRNALVYSRRAAVLSAAGLGLGVALHIIYCLLGIGFIVSRSILLFSIIKFAGAIYLIILGTRGILAARRGREKTTAEIEATVSGGKEMNTEHSAAHQVAEGFLTNALNPKATLFFLSLFTQIVDVKTPLAVQLVYGVEMALATFLWFAFVAHIFGRQGFRAFFKKFQYRLEQFFGAILIALGLRIALTSHK